MVPDVHGEMTVGQTASSNMRRRSSGRRSQGRLSRLGLSGAVPWGFVALWVVLAITGGASRADVLAQPMARAAAILILGAWVLVGTPLNARRYRAPALILAAAALVAALQLIPMPAEWWASLPGREPFGQLVPLIGDAPMRPLALVPDAALNALFSLVVPLSVLVGMMALSGSPGRLVAPVLLATMSWSALLALGQLSTGGFDNPFINNTPGDPAGLFANHNHQALFLAAGLVLAPSWGVSHGSKNWRVGAASVMILLFALMIVASGSRAGVALGAGGLVIGILIAWRDIVRLTNRWPRHALPIVLAVLVLGMVALVWAGLASNRFRSIDRLLALETGADMRARALPIVLELVGRYFPTGAGLGAFDAVFRMAEPVSLLKPTYFNHAHDDWLEVVLETGLPGLLVLTGAVVWWGITSWRAWRADGSRLARQGSAVILLVLLASIVDYPARTPMIMALLTAAACWLTVTAHDLATEKNRQ